MEASRRKSDHFRQKLGAPPGSYRIISDQRREEAEISLYVYGPDRLEKMESLDPEVLDDAIAREGTKWLRMNRIHDPKILDWMRDSLQIDPLVLEDMVNIDVKPKTEDHGDLLFIIAKIPYLDGTGNVLMDHMAVLVLEDMVVTVNESQGHVLDPLVSRLGTPNGRMRSMGPGYMAYAALDTAIDSFILTSKILEEDIESLDDRLDGDSADDLIVPINDMKQSISRMRKEAGPMHQAVRAIRDGTPVLMGGDAMNIYLNDLLDHTSYVIDSLETYRELLMDMHQLCLAMISNNMNKVMKVLTVVATVFIPLTFVAGVYGMNFDNMPELGWEYGYFVSLVGMLVIAFSMLVTFRRRGWF